MPLNMSIGKNALRSSPIGQDPSVARAVAGASKLLLDMQGLSAVHEQIGRVSQQAGQDATSAVDNPAAAIVKLASHLKELVCSYVYTYDSALSPRSEIPRVQSFVADGGRSFSKDPADMLLPVAKPLTVPSLLGNVFHLAFGDDVEAYNPPLAQAMVTLRAAFPDKSDTELAGTLMPTYGVNRSQVPAALLTRWSSLIDLTAAASVEIDGVTTATVPDASEVLAIAGLKNVPDWRLFALIREVDSHLAGINLVDARNAVELFQELGGSPNHQALWLARGKLLVAPRRDLTALLAGFMADKLSPELLAPIWAWLTEAPVVAPLPSSDSPLFTRLMPLFNASTSFVTTRYEALVDAVGITSEETALAEAEATFTRWRNTFRSAGGVLGFEGIVVLAALTALERVKAAALAGLPDAEIEAFADEGLKLMGYMSNPGALKTAFQALKEK